MSIETQLRDYGAHFEADLPEIDLATITAPTRPVRVGSTRPRPWLVMAGAAILVFVLIGGFVLLIASGERPVIDESPSTTVPTAPSTTLSEAVPTTTPDAAPTTVAEVSPSTTLPRDPQIDFVTLNAWEPIADAAGLFEPGAWVEGVIEGADGLVAVGPSGAWWNADGTEWVEAEIDDLPAGSWIGDVAVGPGGLLAVGTVTEEDGPMKAAIWRSQTGRQWSRVPHDEEVFGNRGAHLEGVVAGGPGWVVAGGAFPDPEGPSPSVPTIWTSADGVEWSRTVLEGSGSVLDVTIVGDKLIGVGSVGDDEDDDAMVWVSDDAVNWERLGQAVGDEGVFGDEGNVVGDQWISQIAAREDGTLVAVGAEYDIDGHRAVPTIWYSVCPSLESTTQVAKGAYCWTWYQEIDLDGYAEGVVATQSGFIVAGYTMEDPESGVIWASEDADTPGYLDWRIVSGGVLIPDAELRDIAVSDGRAIAVGISYGGPPLWVSTGNADP